MKDTRIVLQTDMQMSYELITPERAGEILARNFINRRISNGTVQAYSNDILAGGWDEETGSAISIDKDGILRDGQQRLSAVIKADHPIKTWVCYGVSKDGIYDNNRKRSSSDQIAITRPDLEKVYKNTRTISVIRGMIIKGGDRRTITNKELIHYIEEHKKELDGFFLKIPQSTITKISIATVHLAMLLAYVNGVNIKSIEGFYDILCSGMSTKKESFPVIAYRNYLKDQNSITTTNAEVGRCQYALKKYISGSCTKRSVSPKELIWPYPYISIDKED